VQRLTSAELDDRIDLVVDKDADPADWDQALARFLLSYLRSKQSRSPSAAPAEAVEESDESVSFQ